MKFALSLGRIRHAPNLKWVFTHVLEADSPLAVSGLPSEAEPVCTASAFKVREAAASIPQR